MREARVLPGPLCCPRRASVVPPPTGTLDICSHGKTAGGRPGAPPSSPPRIGTLDVCSYGKTAGERAPAVAAATATPAAFAPAALAALAPGVLATLATADLALEQVGAYLHCLERAPCQVEAVPVQSQGHACRGARSTRPLVLPSVLAAAATSTFSRCPSSAACSQHVLPTMQDAADKCSSCRPHAFLSLSPPTQSPQMKCPEYFTCFGQSQEAAFTRRRIPEIQRPAAALLLHLN